jgi:hypothetical protein
MYGLAYVLIPGRFGSLQSELDRTLARFQRGGEDAFPREKLAFDDAMDGLDSMHPGRFRYKSRRSDGATPGAPQRNLNSRSRDGTQRSSSAGSRITLRPIRAMSPGKKRVKPSANPPPPPTPP